MKNYVFLLIASIFIFQCAASAESTFDDEETLTESISSTTSTLGVGGGFAVNLDPPSIDGNFGLGCPDGSIYG